MKNLLLAAAASLVLPAAALAADALAADARVGFQREAIKDLRERARYPEWSRPVNVGDADPVLSARQPTRQALAGPGGAGPTLGARASTIRAEAGDTVDLFAQLTAIRPDTNKLGDVLKANRTIIAAQVTGKVAGEASGILTEVVYADDGRAPDLKANDGIYSTRLTLPAARAPAPGKAESLMVTVKALTAAGDERTAVGGVLFSNPGATLTGRYTDVMRNGNLVLAAEVDVATPGRYHLSGTLADARGVPVVSAQSAKVLAPGKHWLELSYYGLAFHDRGAAGPMTLSAVTLTATNGMPNALGRVLANAYVTKPLNLLALTKLPYNDPNLIETARRLELEVK